MTNPVQRLDEALFVLCKELGVLFLNVRRVSKHYRTEIPRRRRRPDRTRVPFSDQVWQPTGMIDVSMRENNSIESLDRQGELVVFLCWFLAFFLENPAV